jgi:hypothetical protein
MLSADDNDYNIPEFLDRRRSKFSWRIMPSVLHNTTVLSIPSSPHYRCEIRAPFAAFPAHQSIAPQ